jgi:diguanylate cyclase (GGDEF)-like protein
VNTTAKILVVGASQQDLKIHAATLRNQGYEVWCACDAEQTLKLLEMDVPDLFLIETGHEDLDGYTLCARIKQDPRQRNIPVIFLTAGRTPEEINRGFSAGGVDFIVKPCHLSEFLSRVETHIKLHKLLVQVEQMRESDIDSNPLTRLPGNNTIVASIQDAIDTGRDVAVIYTDLDNFKSYNDAYGFSCGDDLLLFNAEVLYTALRKVCEKDSFLGHIGGDDFVMIVPAEIMHDVGAEVIRRFDEGVPSFYKDADRERGHIISMDRRGDTQNFPLMSLSLGGMVLRDYWFSRAVEVAEVCAELKHGAKEISGSNLLVDRREATPNSLPESVAASPVNEPLI